ncbi:hypothetical protein CYMTET_55610 [Cymbomonas tetramitiformis]|uniref:Uncharacterized protein n=1 Tax=Cymbomonas tetramitiformis TaxID=36881 RepID=A0AAE0BCZ4_9CHLO|nr:hypothetical protein CYMTET_55610 [Cymbomonas tetramitiformis]
MASRLLESMEDVRREEEHLGAVEGQGGGIAEARCGGVRAGIGGPNQAASSVEDILNEWDDLSSPAPEGGVWTQEQSGASPEQAMALAEGGVASLMGTSMRVAGLLGEVDGIGGTDENDGGDVGRLPRDHAVGGSLAAWDMSLVVEGWLDWRGGGSIGGGVPASETQQQCAGRAVAEGLSSGGRGELASGTSQQCAGDADADGLGWLSEA